MALFSRVHTWVSNEILTASDLNAEFNNLLTNAVDSSVIGSSAGTGAMQAVADPGGVGTESLAGSVHDELLRLRFKIKQLMNGAQWYSTPVGSLSTGGIVAANLAADSVITAKILDANVTRAKIADAAINTAKLDDASVTQAKKAAAIAALSSSSGTGYTNSTTSFTDVTNLTATITTSTRPVLVSLQPDGSSNGSVQASCAGGDYCGYTIKVLRGASTIFVYESFNQFNVSPATTFLIADGNGFNFIDTGAGSGSSAYKVQAALYALATGTVTFKNMKLAVTEL